MTALILLIAVSLLALFSARIVINETQVAASDYRTSQAVETAMAAFDRGLAQFNADGGRIDVALTAPTQAQLDALVASCTTATPVTDAQEIFLPDPTDPTTPRTLGLYYFANTGANDRCGAGGDPASGTIVSVGWSDDCEAQRTVSACLGTVPIFRDGAGPKQPFVTGASVGVTGNASIINRYTDISVWAGDSAAVAGNSFGTYLRPSFTSITDFTPAQLQDNDPANNAQLVSNRNSGFGVDVVLGDVSLANLTDDEFFGLFFLQDKQAMRDLADAGGNRLDPGTFPPANTAGNVTSGLYWVGNAADLDVSATNTGVNGGVFGSLQEPVVIIINGDLSIAGNGELYGVLYVTGELKITGTPTVYGTVVSENGPNTGAGTLNLVYVPFGGYGGLPPPPIVDSGVVIPGSWRDW
ncbi:hypothetical protein [Haliea sp. E1-2-M8]|uniref:hypothetical protein n=1 Tax=Haliea sp. E1-2-M8 TaxID=3064706 RepID=UPI00272BB4C5|nr:hypothetical protein [Haliea sp. E1-2-M8]